MGAPKKPRGNAGKGRPKGSKNKRTVAREMEETILRQKIKERIEPILEAQFANAQGIKYIVVRQKRGGKFVRVTQAMAEARKGLSPDEEIIEVWEKDPSVLAFKELLDRAYGKAKEPDKNVNLRLPEMQAILERLTAARGRLKGGDSSTKR